MTVPPSPSQGSGCAGPFGVALVGSCASHFHPILCPPKPKRVSSGPGAAQAVTSTSITNFGYLASLETSSRHHPAGSLARTAARGVDFGGFHISEDPTFQKVTDFTGSRILEDPRFHRIPDSAGSQISDDSRRPGPRVPGWAVSLARGISWSCRRTRARSAPSSLSCCRRCLCCPVSPWILGTANPPCHRLLSLQKQ